MECLATAKLPEGPNWVWEIKLDGYRALAVKNAVHVREVRTLSTKRVVARLGGAARPGESKILQVRVLPQRAR
jgi:hypothetical protein